MLQCSLIFGSVLLGGYYGMAGMGMPWGMYQPAGLIGATGQVGAPRRPLTPNGNELGGGPGQYQVIPAYYDQNGGIVMGARGATPLRLVSPASVMAGKNKSP